MHPLRIGSLGEKLGEKCATFKLGEGRVEVVGKEVDGERKKSIERWFCS